MKKSILPLCLIVVMVIAIAVILRAQSRPARLMRIDSTTPPVTDADVAAAKDKVKQDLAALAFDGDYADQVATARTSENFQAQEDALEALQMRPAMVAYGVYGLNPPANSAMFTTVGGYSALSTNESVKRTAWPVNCKASALYVTTVGKSSAPTTVSLRVNGSGTPLGVTVLPDSAAGVYADTADAFGLSAGDLVDYQVSQGPATGPEILGISLVCN